VNRVREEQGYSLIELLVVMVILGIVVGGLTTVFVSGSKAELDMNKRFTAQQNARLALSQLRNDLHVACNADTTTPGRLVLFPSAGSSSTPTCSATANVVWCATTSANNAARYALYQASASSCATPPSGKLYADYLTTNALFTKNTPAAGSKQRTSVTVDLPVNSNKASSATTSVDRYELKDTIVLRNSLPG
jgi:prepilin-type N-terminal cleavage/methylation domain-containing protein